MTLATFQELYPDGTPPVDNQMTMYILHPDDSWKVSRSLKNDRVTKA